MGKGRYVAWLTRQTKDSHGAAKDRACESVGVSTMRGIRPRKQAVGQGLTEILPIPRRAVRRARAAHWAGGPTGVFA